MACRILAMYFSLAGMVTWITVLRISPLSAIVLGKLNAMLKPLTVNRVFYRRAKPPTHCLENKAKLQYKLLFFSDPLVLNVAAMHFYTSRGSSPDLIFQSSVLYINIHIVYKYSIQIIHTGIQGNCLFISFPSSRAEFLEKKLWFRSNSISFISTSLTFRITLYSNIFSKK